QVSGLGPSVAITLYGSEATLQFKDGHLYGAKRGDNSFDELEIPPHEGGGWRVEEEFIAAIQGLEPIRLTTFETGLNYMAFTEAVWRSLSEQRSIPLHTITGGR
ncbi:MAG: hypothetical protein AAF708_23325, partial [Deinococcota bacterium]